MLVSVIVPVYNSSLYLEKSLECIIQQKYRPLEIIFYDDASTDDSVAKIHDWISNRVIGSDLKVKVGYNISKENKGPGFARNEAVLLSMGTLICHFDSDDMMHPDRILEQVQLYLDIGDENCMIGCNFDREPANSTPYYSSWLNSMSDSDLLLQKFRECTIICPSWIYSRKVYDKIADYRYSRSIKQSDPLSIFYNNNADNIIDFDLKRNRAFVETSTDFLINAGIYRVPEDLYFFLDHLKLGGKLAKVNKPLITYRYTPGSWTLGSKKQDLAKVRASYFESIVLSGCDNNDFQYLRWKKFQIWGCGKDGRKFFNLLSQEAASRVVCFLDVDIKKIGRNYYSARNRRQIPVHHFSDLREGEDGRCLPIIVCVGSKHTNGELEDNIKSLSRGLIEGVDYLHFS